MYGGYGNGNGNDDDWAYGDDWATSGGNDNGGDGDILNAELAQGEFDFDLLPLTFVQDEGSSVNGFPLGLCQGVSERMLLFLIFHRVFEWNTYISIIILF